MASAVIRLTSAGSASQGGWLDWKTFFLAREDILQSRAGGEVLRISSDGEERRILEGFESFDSQIFLGRKIWQVFLWVAWFILI